MYPILFRLGPFTLHAFGALMALGFLAALVAMRRLGRDRGWTDDELSRLLVWIMVGGVFGARLAYVAEHWRGEFAGRVGAIFRIDQGGLMFYGGLIGAVLALVLFARVSRRPFPGVIDLCATVLPLGHAFGRMGCFLNGCCHGRVYDGPGAVRFPAQSLAWQEQVHAGLLPPMASHSLPLVPTQLLEAAANVLLYVVLYRLARRQPRPGVVTAAYLLLYPPVRFVMEALRGDPRMEVGALTIGQVISMGLFAGGLVLAWVLSAARRRAAPGAGG